MSIDDIIERSSVSNQTFYKRFDNKACLLNEVVQNFTADLIDERRSVDADLLAMPVKEALVEFACRLLQQTLRADTLAFERLLLSIVREFPSVSSILGAMIDAICDTVVDLLRAAEARRELSIDDIQLTARWFVDGAIAPRIRQASFGLAGLDLTETDRAEIDAYVVFYLRSLRRG